MSLDLDARQRAILQEMGISVWAPLPAAPTGDTAAVTAAPRAEAAAPAAPQPVRGPAQAAPMPPPARAPAAAPAPAPQPPAAPTAGPGLVWHAPVTVYPQADPATTPTGLGAGWLVVVESATPGQPLQGDAGRLLDNMLRAMQLHKHPRTHVATLGRAGVPGAEGPAEPADGMAQALEQLRPALVLVLGLGAARAVLGSREPLGRLRAGVQSLAGRGDVRVPAVVSYDPAYLLRAPDAKAGAWADLCRALALVRGAA
ncbi:uracil-DNA glycosylase family protein [Acidovorax sp. FG27]|uniref:uracil-DNA glycosylase family protein n=1 Tax=Acidovorax sp. FG27 TaxID=3133652 RepID=UPI0030E77CFD